MKRFASLVPMRVVLLVFGSKSKAVPKVPPVAILCAPSCTGVTFDALVDELRNFGWVEGTTIVLERKEAGSRFDQLPAVAADVVRTKPDLIVAFNPQPVRAVKDATSDIPIVMLF